MTTLDDYITGRYDSDAPFNRPEVEEMVECDCCGEMLPEDEAHEDSGWYWCDECFNEMEDAT